MERIYYKNGEYRCPMCGGLMLPRYGNEWECGDCDMPGYETWLGDTGYIDVDVEAWEDFLEESNKEDEERMRLQIDRYRNES